MNFDLTDDQRALQEAARRFAENELAPHAAKWDAESIFPIETMQAGGELGFMGLYATEAGGGLALPRLDSSIVFEELARGCTATAAFMSIHNMATWMVTEFGNEALVQEWGPRLSSGEILASYCLTEAGAGSDAGSLKTSAKRDGDSYVLNGSKSFISGSGATGVLVVMARTGEDGPKGISTFLVPADTDGISFGKKEEKMGWNCQPTRVINFDDARVPATHRLGEEGDGFKIAMKGLDGGRINIATCSVGTAQAALKLAQSYLQERKQFGKPLAAFQALQFKLADMATELVAARLMVRQAAYRLDTRHPEATAYCAMAKRLATDLCFNICNEALQLHGGYGYMKEYPLERMVRDTRVHQILEGTNEIMRLIVARRVLDHGALENLS